MHKNGMFSEIVSKGNIAEMHCGKKDFLSA